MLKRLVGKPEGKQQRVRASSREFAPILAKWQRFYANNALGNFNFSQMQIPVRQPGLNMFLAIPAGLTYGQVLPAFQEVFATNDPDSDFDGTLLDERNRTEHYGVWVSDQPEVSSDLLGCDALSLSRASIKTQTLLERLIHGMWLFQEKGQYLDLKHITLCSGSWNNHKMIPTISTRPLTKTVIFGWWPHDKSDDHHGPRIVGV